MTDLRELYAATQMLFRAFQYLHPRMRGGSLAPPEMMNAEALAGCLLHGCMSRLLREIQVQRAQSCRKEWPSGWIARPPLVSAESK